MAYVIIIHSSMARHYIRHYGLAGFEGIGTIATRATATRTTATWTTATESNRTTPTCNAFHTAHTSSGIIDGGVGVRAAPMTD